MTAFGFIKRSFIFLFTLITVGTVLGTFTIVLLLKSIIIYIRYTGYMAHEEKIVSIALLLGTALFSLLISKWLTRWFFMNKTSANIKIGYLITLSLILSIFVYFWSTPTDVYYSATLASKNGRFIGGAYPDKQQLIRLKQEGYTDIISLLEPLKLPDEPFLLTTEYQATKDADLNLISIPMISSKIHDLEAEEQIKRLIKDTTPRKYFVHGYYDKSRMKLFIKLIDKYDEQMGIQNPVHQVSTPTTTLPETQKTDYTTYNFQRGFAIAVDKNLIVSPKPTAYDYKELILTSPNQQLNTKINTIISLDTEEPSEEYKQLIEELRNKGISYISMPMSAFPYDSNKILQAASQLKTLPGTTLIYSYNMPPQSTVLTGTILSYLTGLPTLPFNQLLSEPMQAGAVKIIAPNVALGKRPSAQEFQNYLKSHSVKNVLYVGNCQGIDYNTDHQLSMNNSLAWACYQSSSIDVIVKTLSADGPWYVYGTELDNIEHQLNEQLGNKIPSYLQPTS